MTLRGSMLTAALLCCVGCAILPVAAALECPDDASCGSADAGVPDGYTTGLDGSYGDTGVYTPSARSSLCATAPCDPQSDTACTSADAGDASDAAPEACHMVVEGQQTASMCLNAGTGTDGTSCTVNTQCAAGFECVANNGDGGTVGTCRHYCCEDSPCTAMTDESITYFCDIATEVQPSSEKVPVCFVVSPCMPLGQGTQCYYGQVCTIVEIDNSKSLVATCDTEGTGALGDSCETEQCMSGMACIGATGQRTCQQLCNGDHPCPGSMTCNMQSQALATFFVGVCS